jgi:hypothetical protein
MGEIESGFGIGIGAEHMWGGFDFRVAHASLSERRRKSTVSLAPQGKQDRSLGTTFVELAAPELMVSNGQQ